MGTDISLTVVFAPQGEFPCDQTWREHGRLVPRKNITLPMRAKPAPEHAPGRKLPTKRYAKDATGEKAA